MDEPASALDPISTTRIEDLMHELKRDYTIIIVTHNMQQAARVADMTAFFSVLVDEDGGGPARHSRRVRLDDEDLHDAVRQAHRGLRHREIRMRVEFQGELDALEAGFQETGEIVLRSIRGVVDALRTQDVELCDEVIAFDDEIDDRYHGLEKQIELVLARQTPVAGDLRLVLALLHSGLHVERMGDQCVTIAKLTKLSSHLDTKQTVIESLVDMGERCEEMVKVSLDAFAARDVETARGLHGLDDLVDRANRQVFGEVLGYVHDPEALEWGMRQITVARCFERIGDNAVDIGEQTAFLVTGEFAEFTDASH